MTINIIMMHKVALMGRFLLIFLFPLQDELDIDFTALGLAMAAISFGLIGLLMTGAAFFGEQGAPRSA